MSSRPAPIGPVYQHRQNLQILPEARITDFIAAARAHPGGFEFDGRRYRVVEDMYSTPGVFTAVGPGGATVHAESLGRVPAQRSDHAAAAAAAAERRARAWDDRIARSRKRRKDESINKTS